MSGRHTRQGRALPSAVARATLPVTAAAHFRDPCERPCTKASIVQMSRDEDRDTLQKGACHLYMASYISVSRCYLLSASRPPPLVGASLCATPVFQVVIDAVCGLQALSEDAKPLFPVREH